MTNTLTTNGFVVLRKPHMNKVQYTDLSVTPRVVDNKIYSGIDRLAWEEVVEAMYADKLPESLKNVYEPIGAQLLDGLHLTDNYDTAVRLLRFSEQPSHENDNEIIAIYADELQEIRPPFAVEDCEMEFLGWDIKALWGWSLLFQGVFEKPSLFESYRAKLNVHGLFECEDVIPDYIAYYLELADDKRIELLPEWSVSEIIGIALYRLANYS